MDPTEVGFMPATRIVIVDDHDLVREGLSALLRQAGGLEIAGQANSGESGIALVKETRPDIVLMDVQMEGMNGIEATRQIVSAFPEVRVIALTMMNDTSVLEAMLRAGAMGFILKCEPPAVLIQAIREVAARRPFLCPAIASKATESFMKLLQKFSPAESAGLTPAECTVLALTAQGKSIKEIAAELKISVRTVNGHRSRIHQKLGISGDAQMTKAAIKLGLATIEDL
ncbi:MAG TPA: response regulator transcription factor [Planctomycetota bacterium]